MATEVAGDRSSISLSGSGKSTIANALEKHCTRKASAPIPDGDNIPPWLEYISVLPTPTGSKTSAAAAEVVSYDGRRPDRDDRLYQPFRAERQMARELTGKENFIEALSMRRDRASNAIRRGFTGKLAAACCPT